jgi:pyruvate/2-oxoglutarate dehydrogenase complex dihydrolipoamide dehydrogenase (E3) component/uncharacterized membrane protein YdjX (TVP38/TMEM64 family)
MNAKKILLLAALLLCATLFFALDLHHALNLDALRKSQERLAALYAQSPVTVALVYFALYVVATALSFPGATIITLAGGAVFGLGWGLLIVSFASTLGATLAFLVSRYLLRDWVQARFASRMGEINRGLAQDGALYLFSLRLIPVVPFFLINLAMGLTTMRLGTYYWVSQLGMLAGTAVYVNAGTQLGRIHTLGDVASPGLLGAFVLLGLFPLLARRLVDAVRRRQVYARWKAQRPTSFDRNLVVIGAGAGGLVTSYIAAAVKAKVTLVEAHAMGGDCLNTGCVPSKALIQSARVAHEVRHAAHYGVHGAEAQVNFRAVMQRVQAVIQQIAPHDSVERYTALGVEVLQGKATLVNPWTVEIALNSGGTQRLTTRSIVIAAGAKPVVPPLPGLDAVAYVTSDTLWDHLAQLDQVPQRLTVLGGGPIGCELAQSFARLGSAVTLVEAAPRLLLREDDEVSERVASALQSDGVQVLTAHRACRVEANATTPAAGTLVVEHNGAERPIAFDLLLIAVGRSARLTGYGLEALGIPTDTPTLQTNDYLQTLYPNIYAVGDVAGPFQFTHTAAHQAWYAAVNALFGDVKRFKADYGVIPQATFVDPEVARVGLNEREAQAQGIAYALTRYATDDLDRQICDAGTGQASAGWVKVLTVPGQDRILGVAIVGTHAAERLAEYVLAMRHGLGLKKILGTIHTYPTLAEANKYAAGEWARAHQPHTLLAWARRFHTWRRG